MFFRGLAHGFCHHVFHLEALKQPDVATRVAADGSIPVGSSPEQFNAHIKSEIAKWKKLVKEANLRLDNN